MPAWERRLTGWGEALRLYDRFGYYDVVVHFLVRLRLRHRPAPARRSRERDD